MTRVIILRTKSRETIRNDRMRNIERRKILFTKSSDEFNKIKRFTVTQGVKNREFSLDNIS